MTRAFAWFPLVALLLAACDGTDAKAPSGPTELQKQLGQPCDRYEWQSRPSYPYADNLEYVCLSTRESVGTVRRTSEDKALWSSYVRGAGYGEFLDGESAKRRVEVITKSRGFGPSEVTK